MQNARVAPRLQLVVKVSKYCNLRCTYCYEFNELNNKARMSLENIGYMLRNLRSALDVGLISGIEFIWHGGEPFLIPIDYYRQIGALQRAIFPDPETYQNLVQTNLTVLTVRHIEFLKERSFFHHIGISFDVFGDQRVDASGRLRNDAVMANMQKLIEEDIEFGAITVLCRDTIGHARRIQRFWQTLGKGYRLLPFHLSTGPAQSWQHALSGEELVATLRQCFLDWLASDQPTRIDPMCEYLSFALDYIAEGPKNTYDPIANEVVFVLNVDGSISGSGQGEIYGPEFIYGNLFSTCFEEILGSTPRLRAGLDTVARMERFCGSCPYYGYCPGYPVADASHEEIQILERSGCTVRHVMDFMVDTLRRSDVADELAARLKGQGIASETIQSAGPSRTLL
jgi:uncharacterized protein